MCVKRLRQLHSRLKRDKQLLKGYDSIIKEQEKAGIIEPASKQEQSSHFLPHHGVVRQDKETTKLRVVFDGSAKPGNDSLSLNDCLEKGPNLVPHLFDTVVKFRGYPIGIVADIEKAFHQIQIAPTDRSMLQFLWFDDIDKDRPEIKPYKFRRLPFGLTPSPAILASTIRYHLSRFQEREPMVVSLLRNSLYVDDFAGGAREDTEALEIYHKSQELMNKGGFTLRKWNSNSKCLQERIAAHAKPNLSSEGKQEGVQELTRYVKFLGINWNVETDEFQYDLTELLAYAQSLPATKRSVLRLSAKIFDPMGLVTPFTITMKMLFQSLCITGVDWDEKLEGEALAKWTSLVKDFQALNNVRVPRCYFHSRPNELSRNHQLHGFCDASDDAFAAAVYLRTDHGDGDVEINLVASKTRVAPIKKQSTPRLELLGANILARLVHSILRAITSLTATPDVILWTDSFTTLCWIRNDKVWKQYVQRRVREIRELTSKRQWRHCPGHINPADLPSRGCSGQELARDETWWNGPHFLKLPEDQWPKDPQPTSKDREQALTEVLKHPPTQEMIAVGDVVILKNDNVSRAFWKLATVKELLRSDDGVVRSAKVRVVSNDKGKVTELRRPIQYLVPLELQMVPEPQNPPCPNVVPTTPTEETTTRSRPRRTAAVIGELLRNQK